MSVTEPSPTPPPKQALVVEPNAAVAAYLRRTLEAKGFSVRHAITAADARGWLPIERFDLAVVDELLPDEPFEALILHLRQAQVPPPLLLFMLSRATLKRVGNGAREIGALFGPGAKPDIMITKPFGVGEFSAMIDWQITHGRL